MGIRSLASRALSGLQQEKVPLWLNLLLIFGAAVGTYALAPVINAKFEQQKIRSQFVVDALDNLNSQTSELIVSVGDFNYCVKEAEQSCSPHASKIHSSIAKLQWRATELGAVIDDRKGRAVLLEFQATLDELRIASQEPPSIENSAKMMVEAREFGRASIKLTDVIASEAGISTNVQY